jgi:tetratricopeptide (TPR) repeat protein
MHRRAGKAAMTLAQQMLAWCPMDNIGVRFLLGDIALLKGDHHAALQAYLKGAPNSPAHCYQAALIAFREGDYVAACTYLRRGIAANPYIAEGLTGRTVLTEHLYWNASNVHSPEWAVDYLESAACAWTAEEIDFVDWWSCPCISVPPAVLSCRSSFPKQLRWQIAQGAVRVEGIVVIEPSLQLSHHRL